MKKCSCGKIISPENTTYIGSMYYGQGQVQRKLMLYNCPDCKSTVSLKRVVRIFRTTRGSQID